MTPLSIISPTTVEGKRIYREAWEEEKGCNTELSPTLRNQWLRWTRQLKNITVPRSMVRATAETKTAHFHIFADASNLACCALSTAVVEHESDVVKGLRVKVKNLQTWHIDCQSRADQWSHGSKPGEKCLPRIEEIASGNCNNLYG